VAKIDPKLIKELREQSGAGMLDCKEALEATGGDLEKASAWLRERGIAKAGKRAGRETANGVVEAYLHKTGDYPPQTGALIELNCETDFVAKGEEFRNLAREIAIQVAAMAPRWVSREEIPAEAIEEQKAAFREEAAAAGKSERATEPYVNGKLEGFFKTAVLLEQAYVREPKTTVGDLIAEQISKLQENITVRRFARFNIKEP